jgi:hypothetical protein
MALVFSFARATPNNPHHDAMSQPRNATRTTNIPTVCWANITGKAATNSRQVTTVMRSAMMLSTGMAETGG